MRNPLPGVGDQMDRKRQGRQEEAEERFPVCFCLPPDLLLVRAKPHKPIQVGHTRTLASRYVQMESDSRMEKLQEKVTNTERKCEKRRAREIVCVPVPEISLMAAVSFYLMGGRKKSSRER